MSRKKFVPLKARMMECEVTQKDLGEALNRSHTYVTKRINGHVPFDTHDMEVIGGLLGIPKAQWLDYFVDDRAG